jgi:hypothetical protein
MLLSGVTEITTVVEPRAAKRLKSTTYVVQ